LKEADEEECKGIAFDVDDNVVAKAPKDLGTICKMPIERSASSLFGEGAQLLKANRLLMDGATDWKRTLGEEWVKRMFLDGEHTLFRCIECGNVV
jgi:hypothetical protein